MELLTPVAHVGRRAAERLEAEICELAGHLAAATCRFLLLLAEFDRLEGWSGHRSCAHWLSWRCGLSGAAAREHVRVGRALEEFAVIREAFAAGRLSYSKVRAITRVATARNETELVQTALATTAAQVERIVRAMRHATREQVRERRQRRSLAWWWDDDGTMVLRVRLDPDEGAVVLAALRAARSPHPHPAVADDRPGTAAGSPPGTALASTGRSGVVPPVAPSGASPGTRRNVSSKASPAPEPAASSGTRPVASPNADAAAAPGSRPAASSGTRPAASPGASLVASPGERPGDRASMKTAEPHHDAPAVGADTGMDASAETSGRDAVPGGAGTGRDTADPAVAARGSRRAPTAPKDAAVGASAEASEGLRGAPSRSSIPLVDAFSAVMTSYLGSAARDAADPEAFQVVVITDAIGPSMPQPTASQPAASRPAESMAAESESTAPGATASRPIADGTGPTFAARAGGSSPGDAVADGRDGGRSGAAPGGRAGDRSGLVADEPVAGQYGVGNGVLAVGPGDAPASGSTGHPGGAARGDAQACGGHSGSEPPSASPGGITDDGIPLPRDTVLRIACGSAVVQAAVGPIGIPVDLGRKTRRVNGSLRRALRLRDAAGCRLPGCTARRRLHAHHIRHWADGGPTSLRNLILLCPQHHWAVHEGGHAVSVDEQGRLRFTRPDGTPLPFAPGIGPASGDLVTSDDGITPDTIVPWDGTPLDLDHAVVALLQPALSESPAVADSPTSGRPAA